MGSGPLLVIDHSVIACAPVRLSLRDRQTDSSPRCCLWYTFPVWSQKPYDREEEAAFVSRQTHAILTRLLPDATTLRLEACAVDDATAQITLRVRSTQTHVPCPLCDTPARRIHSHYARTLVDLPWAAYHVCLQLHGRKWFCGNRACRRRIFTERLPTVAAPWARRTLRLAQRLVALGVALGGKAGVHLGHQWALVVSRATLLRLVHRQPAPAFPTPTVLGVDDFALRKRQTYGTILVDLERRQPVALLSDRTAETVAQWLRAHPGVEVIARDRSTAYADGARQGAPAATQVADRFHLLQNLREALDQVFSMHSQALDAVNVLMHQQPVPLPDGALAVPVPPHDLPLPAQQRAAERQARRQALHTQVWALHRQGWTAPAIAQQVGLRLRTVQRDLRTATFAGRKRRSDLGDSVLTPYKPYLLERWNAGCYTAMRLFRDLRQRGYAGGYGVVAASARRLRQAQGLPPGHRCPRQALPPVAEAAVPAFDAAPGDMARPPTRGEAHRG